MNIALIKALAHEAFITSLKQKGIVIELKVYEKAIFDDKKVADLVKTYGGALQEYKGKGKRFDYILQGERGKKTFSFKPAEIFKQLNALISDIKKIKPEIAEDKEKNKEDQGSED